MTIANQFATVCSLWTYIAIVLSTELFYSIPFQSSEDILVFAEKFSHYMYMSQNVHVYIAIWICEDFATIHSTCSSRQSL